MTLRTSIAIVVATAVAGAAMAACGSDGRAHNSTESTSPQANPATAASGETTTSTSSTVPMTTAPSQATTTTVMTTTSRPVFDFLTAGSADGWRVTNDTVMGGVSNGELAWIDGVLMFTGELSLANGGGFASIRSPEIDPQRAVDWSSRTGPRVQVDGDGRTWTVELRTNDESGGWISSFPTSPDGLTDVELPWASFMPVTRFLEPRATDELLDPARIVSLAFYLVDGIEGSFRLGVRSIA
ncbi:MAG: CIA30 family protein [Ilumatobacteraceae bacterium]|nr:CIA30 family protein [Ilumatobacteraceae bacterium]